MTALLALLLAGAPAYQDTGSIDQAIAAFTSHGIGEEGGARTTVDARLRLVACPMVSLSWRTEARDAVVVACPAPAWRLFVPVMRSPGVTPAGVTAVAQAVVRAAPIIKRGDPVMVEAGTEDFSITREGIAMGDAAPGSRFLVKVEDVKSPVQAVATADGRALLPGWTK